MDRDSKVLRILQKGTEVNIVAIHLTDRRMRGELDDGSWTTLHKVAAGHEFLKKYEPKLVIFFFILVKQIWRWVLNLLLH